MAIANSGHDRDPKYLLDLLGLSYTPRWVTHPLNRAQTVAEHSYRVAVIAMHMYELLYRDVVTGSSDWFTGMLRVVRWALMHDGPESKLGDMPMPAKDIIGRDEYRKAEVLACPWIEEEHPVPHSAAQIVKIADLIEAYTWVKVHGPELLDKFDGENIGKKVYARLWETAKNSNILGMEKAVTEVLLAMSTTHSGITVRTWKQRQST
jgi:5'-deoxynucleotidase YfbR-like HD superfamily hydrolase